MLEQVSNLIYFFKQFAARQELTEHLKAKNQILWVQRMNNIAKQSREIV
ncbi:MAG: TnpV protein [Eubacterium sp.]|nr:TnpV protein [Eubacterium sp.]